MEELPSEPKEGDDRFVEPSKVEPETEQTRATLGTKLFVLFFFLLVPPLGVALVAAVCWKAYRLLMAG
jgi:hypothetical protein